MGKRSGRSGPKQPEAWSPLEHWLQQAKRWLAAEQGGNIDGVERPKSDLVLEALKAGAIPGIDAACARLIDGGSAVELKMKKPKSEGLTKRWLDVQAAAFFGVLSLPGARLSIEAHGVPPAWFYGRIEILGGRKGSRRAYVIRVIAGTVVGVNTKEPLDDFHSWRRSDLKFTGRKKGGKHGLKEVRGWAVDRFREVLGHWPDKLPTGLTPERYAELLDLAQEMMLRRPLRDQPS